jgi:hypothetical protein
MDHGLTIPGLAVLVFSCCRITSLLRIHPGFLKGLA